MSPRRPPRSRYGLRSDLGTGATPAAREPAWADEPLTVHRVTTGGDLLGLADVALTVADPDAMAAFLCDHVGMRELAREPGVTVVGAGEGAVVLLLVEAKGPREPGALGRLVLRVPDVERALDALPAGTAIEGDRFELAEFEGPEGLGFGFTMVAGGAISYDLDSVVLRVSDTEQTRVALGELGCVPRGYSLHVADKHITLEEGHGEAQHPLLEHVGVRVDSVDAVADRARERGLEIEEHLAPGYFAVVLPGPERIRLRFVEHAPG